MSILGQVKVPGAGSSSNEITDYHHLNHSSHNMGFSSKENFDSYLTKLQTICTENLSDEVKPPSHHHHVQAAAPTQHTQPTTSLPTSI